MPARDIGGLNWSSQTVGKSSFDNSRVICFVYLAKSVEQLGQTFKNETLNLSRNDYRIDSTLLLTLFITGAKS